MLDATSKNIILGHETTQRQQPGNPLSRSSLEQQVNNTLVGSLQGSSGHGEELVGSPQCTSDHGEEVDGVRFHDTVTDIPDNSTQDDATILAHVTQHKNLPPGHLNRLLSSSS